MGTDERPPRAPAGAAAAAGIGAADARATGAASSGIGSDGDLTGCMRLSALAPGIADADPIAAGAGADSFRRTDTGDSIFGAA